MVRGYCLWPGRDRHKLRRNVLKDCGCRECQIELKLHAQLDVLIEGTQRREQTITRLEQSVEKLHAISNRKDTA